MAAREGRTVQVTSLAPNAKDPLMNAVSTVTPTPRIAVRPALAEHVPEIHRMLVALAAHHGDTATIAPARLAQLLLEGREVGILVALLPDSPARHPVGYALVTRRTEVISGGIRQDITHLYVQPPFRGMGLGRALIAAAQEQATAEGALDLTIGTHPENKGAAATYRHMGLTERPASGPRFAIPVG